MHIMKSSSFISVSRSGWNSIFASFPLFRTTMVISMFSRSFSFSPMSFEFLVRVKFARKAVMPPK